MHLVSLMNGISSQPSTAAGYQQGRRHSKHNRSEIFLDISIIKSHTNGVPGRNDQDC